MEFEEDIQIEKLCSTCNAIFSTLGNMRALHTSRDFQHSTLETIRSEAAKGCSFCGILLQKVKSSNDQGGDGLRLELLRLRATTSKVSTENSVSTDGAHEEYPFGVLDATHILVQQDGRARSSIPLITLYKPSSKHGIQPKV